jgi:Ner family transcriptional regulator
MRTSNAQASTPRALSATRADWNMAYVLYRLRLSGWSLRSLSRKHGRGPGALRMGLSRGTRWAMEAVADAVGVAPQSIWPTRYKGKR